MAADIKKMVDAICNLTVLELSKLVETLRDKFGLTRSTEEEPIKPVLPDDEPKDIEPEPIQKNSTEPAEPKEKSEPVPDPLAPKKKKSDKVKQRFHTDLTKFDSEWTSNPERRKPIVSPTPPKPKGENYALVYAWRYSDNKKYSKIGESTKHGLHSRMLVTYYPTGDPVLIGIRECKHKAHAEDVEKYILDGLGRTLPRREWVKIDDAFNEMIYRSFICDPDELKKIFGNSMKTDTTYYKEICGVFRT